MSETAFHRSPPLVGRARALLQLGRGAEAALAAKEARAIDPSDPDVAKLMDDLGPASPK